MRVLITGGGTGGHVNPALAIADTIKRNDPDSVIEYVGTSRGIENKLVPKAGYKVHHIEIRGIRRSLSPENIKTAYYALTSPMKAKKLIREFKPDIVIGTGGYVCWPVVKAASEMQIPTALHESNAVPGVAVRMLAGKVDRIWLNFEKTGETLHEKEKLLHVGNPLRTQFAEFSKKQALEKLGLDGKYEYVLLSYGGSLGAEKVNEMMLKVMNEVVSKHPEIYHVHATGASSYEKVKAQFDLLGLDKCDNIRLAEYIYDMPVYMAASDLTVCRAGAMTVSEISAAGKCALFIPSPNVTNNHQFKNASVLADAGAALVYEENGIDQSDIVSKISHLLSKAGDGERVAMEKAVKAFAVKDANRLIYEDIRKMVAESKKIVNRKLR